MSNEPQPAFWWVSQGATYDAARKGGFLWAPKSDKAGKPRFYWDNVTKVRSGDFIFHYADGNLRAISCAKNNGYGAKNELEGDKWSEDGWRVDSDYHVLTRPIPIQEVGSKIVALKLAKGPVNRTGGANEGYLYGIPENAAAILIEAMGHDPALEASGISHLKLTGQQSDSKLTLHELDKAFLRDLETSLIYAEGTLVRRFVSSILAKRFLILTGLAGSGKTKLAQAFARWISSDSGRVEESDPSGGKRLGPYYALVPVGSDWTGNENIVGYPDGLHESNYVTKPALELIRSALEPTNAKIPHFLILDEMNLSHVERYFADLLSAIESGETIPLYEGATRTADYRDVPRKLRLPDNLFIIGTVNVDETTYMFSPKVLDRANVIEFCVPPNEMSRFLAAPKAPRLEALDGGGKAFGRDFVEAAADRMPEVPTTVRAEFEAEMLLFFNLLREHNAEFGYRTGYEAARFVHFYKQLGGFSDDDPNWFREAMDAVVVQKFLPKLHGSRSKLEGLLWALAWACGLEREVRYGRDFGTQIREASTAEDEQKYGPTILWEMLEAKHADEPANAAYYPLSFDKVMRMWRKLIRDQFVSFAEA